MTKLCEIGLVESHVTPISTWLLEEEGMNAEPQAQDGGNKDRTNNRNSQFLERELSVTNLSSKIKLKNYLSTEML